MPEAHPTLLIIDDDPHIHEALRLTLRREHYRVLHAFDAAEGMHMIEADPSITGVLCDQNMPGTTGLDLLVALRLRRPDLPTMVLTGDASVELATRAVNEAGVRGFLPKPWDNRELRRVLRQMLMPDAPSARPEALAVEAVERVLQEELAPQRDPTTGAYIIDDQEL